MISWTLTNEGKELLEEYVTRDIGFSCKMLKNNKLFKKVKSTDFIKILDERVDRKAVYSTKAVSMKQLVNCSSKKSIIWGIKMNLLIGALLYNGDLSVSELSKKLKVTNQTVNEHIALLESCALIKKKSEISHLSDFL